MKHQVKRSLLLLLAALIWGVAFVAQSAGMEYVGGFTFNCIRSLIGGVVLIPVVFLMRRGNDVADDAGNDCMEAGMKQGDSVGAADSGKTELSEKNGFVEEEAGQRDRGEKRTGRGTLFLGGVSCGVVLCIATNFQQFGLKYTSVGKAGFITALYIVLVPVFGLFLHKKVGRFVWIGLGLAVAGLYFLCINEKLSIGIGDLLVLSCAGVFAVHILVVDHFAPLTDCVAMSCIQFFTSGILTAIPMLLFEEVRWQALVDCAVPILYAGVLSSGVAYTLQIVGQKDMNPTVASMLLSMESVFSVIAGALLLHQLLSPREMLGCGLMFAAVILAQLPEKKM